MNSILKEFFHGNLSPANRQMVKGSEIAHIVNELANAEAILEHALASECLPAFNALQTCRQPSTPLRKSFANLACSSERPRFSLPSVIFPVGFSVECPFNLFYQFILFRNFILLQFRGKVYF